MSNKPLILDVSRWQGKLDWDAIAAHPESVRAVCIRLGISYLYVDPWFEYNRTEAERVGIPWGAYHVLYPGVSAIKQVESIFKVLGENFGDMPITADLELDHGLRPEQITNTVRLYLQEIRNRSDRAPLVYSRANWIDRYLHLDYVREIAPLCDWWMAQYLKEGGVEHPGPPVLPAGVSREDLVLHQTSHSMTGIGTAKPTNNTDYNRWQLDEEALQLFLRGGPASPPVTQPDPLRTAIANQFHVVADDMDKLGDLIQQLP